MKNNHNFNGFVKIDHPVKNAFPKSLNICFTYHCMNCKSEVMSRYIGKDDNCANIVLEMNGKIVNLAGRIKSALAHELTYAYEDDNRSLSKPGTSLLKSLNDLYTTSIIIKKNKNEFSRLANCFADCCYWLNPAERRANLGRLENELSEYFVKIYDERSAEKIYQANSII